MVAISSDPRPIVASLPSTYTWESWRLRFLSYGLGSMEFATNAFINVREALNRASQDELDPLTFEGKVRLAQLLESVESLRSAFSSV